MRFTWPALWPALAAAALALAHAAPARADDEPACPLDMFDAASGTWSTKLAETMDACAGDPACSGGATAEPGAPPSLTAPMQPVQPAVPRGRAGRFATAGAAIGVASDTRAGGEARTSDAWLVGEGTARAGWRRGLQACASGRGALGTDSQIESSFGVAFPWLFLAVAIGGGQRWHVRPELASPRVWLRRAVVENYMHAQAAFGVWRHASGGVSAIVPLRVETSARQQLDGPPTPGVSQQLTVSMYEYAGTNVDLELLRLAVDYYYPEGIPSETMPDNRHPGLELARIDPLALAIRGERQLEVDLGFLSGEEPLVCRGCAPVVGTLALGLSRGDHLWQLRLERGAHLAFDARVTVEDRVSMRYRQALGRHTVRLDGFGALTRTTAEGERGLVGTGGIAAGFDAALTRGLTLALDVEAGRSYYARLDSDQAPVAEPVARLGVSLAHRFGGSR